MPPSRASQIATLGDTLHGQRCCPPCQPCTRTGVDKNCDGFISVSELRHALNTTDYIDGTYTAEHAAALLGLADGLGDGDSRVSYEEVFKVFDGNQDGFITIDELWFTILVLLGVPLPHNTLAEMMATADINGDRRVNYTEFVKKMIQG